MLFPRFLALISALCVFAVGPVVQAEYVPQPDTYRSMLVGPDGVQGYGQLGSSMASSGNWIALGAPLDHTGGIEAGVVKIFDAGTGSLVRTVTNPTPTETRGFGTKIALHGSRLAVAVPILTAETMPSGRVYVYDLAAPNPNVPIHTIENPEPGVEGDHARSFGDALILTETRLFIGASRGWESPAHGRIFVYELGGANPTTPALRIPSPPPAS